MAADSHSSPNLSRLESGAESCDDSARLRQLSGSSSDDAVILPVAKRRKNSTLRDNEDSKHQMFYFVDSNSSSKEKRAHVMRHHVQEKRRQRKLSRPKSEPEKKAIQPLRYFPWHQKQGPLQDGLNPYEEAVSPPSHSNGTTSNSTNSPSKLTPEAVASRPTLSLVTNMDASRKDPFNSLPLTSFSREEMELADYWVSKLSYWSGQNNCIKDKVFRTALSYPLAFQAVILAYCARWKAQIFNQVTNDEVVHYVGQAIKSIEAAGTTTTEADGDSLALALAGMALQEDRFGTKEASVRYEDRAIQILRSGSRSGSMAPVFLHYVRFVTAPPQGLIDEGGKQLLVAFLRLAEQLMLAHNTPEYLKSVPQRRTAFEMESPLYPLLSIGPRPSEVPHDSRMYVVRGVPTQEATHTAALIYITLTLWDIQGSASKTGRFIKHICKIATDYGLDRHPACETFIFLLLEEGCDPDLKDPERGWRTGELLKKQKQLPRDLQFQFNETLFRFLTLTRPLRGVDAFENQLFPIVEETDD